MQIVPRYAAESGGKDDDSLLERVSSRILDKLVLVMSWCRDLDLVIMIGLHWHFKTFHLDNQPNHWIRFSSPAVESRAHCPWHQCSSTKDWSRCCNAWIFQNMSNHPKSLQVLPRGYFKHLNLCLAIAFHVSLQSHPAEEAQSVRQELMLWRERPHRRWFQTLSLINYEEGD